MPRILLVDDDAELGSLMTEFFSAHGFELDCVYTGPKGLEAASSGNYELVLLDIMLPGMDGFQVLRRLRETSGVPVLMLTARTEASSRIQGLETGADDYLPKPFEPLELLARVRAVLRRGTPRVASAALEHAGVRLEPATRRAFAAGGEIELTTVEFDILETLMRRAGKVVSRDELARRLYQREATPFERALDVHVSHLRRKLEGAGQPIRTVRGTGYLFAAPGK